MTYASKLPPGGSAEDVAAVLEARRHEPDAAACAELWCAVLWVSLTDIAEVQRYGTGKRLGNAGRSASVHWVGSRDFRMVCALAGLDADAVEQAVRAGRLDLSVLSPNMVAMRAREGQADGGRA